MSRELAIRPGKDTVVGKVALERRTIQVPDVLADRDYSSPEIQRLGNFRTLLGVPMMSEGVPTGVIILWRHEVDVFEDDQIELVATFATQGTIAIASAELFQAINDKNRELEVASRHKSEFLAHMSHELRTPLNAVIGFSEVLLDRLFGEVNAKQEEYLQNILRSGRHLLSLINDVLDVSKVEAGRMELEIGSVALKGVLEEALTLVREQASSRDQTLTLDVEPDLPDVSGRRAQDQAGRHEPRHERREVHAGRRSDRGKRPHRRRRSSCMRLRHRDRSRRRRSGRRSSTRSSRSRMDRSRSRRGRASG